MPKYYIQWHLMTRTFVLPQNNGRRPIRQRSKNLANETSLQKTKRRKNRGLKHEISYLLVY
jgi:hypothetical protein